jgi:sulfur-oxidizing protein SoxZ
MRTNLVLKDGVAELRLLIQHPMETGLRKDKASGQLIPAHFIQNLTVDVNATKVIDVNCGVAVSKDPFFYFKIDGVKAGDNLKIMWVDNKGGSETETLTAS